MASITQRFRIYSGILLISTACSTTPRSLDYRIAIVPASKGQHGIFVMKADRTGGKLLVFVTKRNAITQWLAGKWWKTNLYAEDEMQSYLQEAGFHHIERRRLSAGWSRSIMAIEAEG